MNKKDIVEVESAFLAFVEKAREFGFTFSNPRVQIELQHDSDTKHSMSGRVTLQPTDYI